MSHDTTPVSRTLQRAADIAGSQSDLAARWGVTLPELVDWLGGVTVPPPEVYLEALDIVARMAGSNYHAAAEIWCVALRRT